MQIIMKHFYVIFFVVSMVITSCGLNDKQESPPSDWQALFDGKTFDGWDIKVAGYDLNDNHNNTYLIEDGSIVVSYDQYDSFDEKDGNIFYTKKKFKNYHLKLDYKFYGDHIRDGDWSYRNSGVMLHSEDPKKIFKDQQVPVSIEAQFLGGLQNRSDGIKTTLNMCSPGTDVDIDGKIAPEHCMRSSSKIYPINEWVSIEIVVHSDSIVHHIIEKDTIMTYTNIRYSNDRFSSENFKDLVGKPLEEGYIALQSEGHPVMFRNIMIKELD